MLLKKLVEIESPSGKEYKLKKFIFEYLENLGYTVLESEYFLVANPKKDLIVATHIDTLDIKVPFKFDGVYAYGAGVCDAKASVAAMLEAAEEGVNYTLAFFCDEEEGGKGSKSFVDSWKWGKMAIVMEPTNLKVASTHFGSMDVDVEVKGKAAHASLPEYGVNAVEKVCELLKELKEALKVTPLKIEGGGDEYVIPDICRLKLDVLIPPEVSLDEVLKKLEVIKKYGDFKISDAYEGFKSGKVVEILEKALRLCGISVEHCCMPSWTDALNLRDKFDVVVWGPGELHLCHTRFERVKLEDIEKAKNVLIKLNEVV